MESLKISQKEDRRQRKTERTRKQIWNDRLKPHHIGNQVNIIDTDIPIKNR